MDNNEDNNNLDMGNIKNEKEYYVTQLKKYVGFESENSKEIDTACIKAISGVVCLGYMTHLFISGGMGEDAAKIAIPAAIGFAAVGVPVAFDGIKSIIKAIARRVGYENRINVIMEKLEILDPQRFGQTDEQTDYEEEEKGRRL